MVSTILIDFLAILKGLLSLLYLNLKAIKKVIMPKCVCNGAKINALLVQVQNQ